MLRTCPRFAAVLLAGGCIIGIAGCRVNGDTGTGGASGRGASGTGGGASGGSGGGSATGSGGVSAGSGGASGGSGGVSGGSGGVSGGSGGVSGGSGGVSGGSGGMAGTPGETCDQAPTPLRQSGTIIALPIETVYDGMPFVFGEPNQVAGGATVTTLNFRFYVSHVELIAAGGAAVPVDIVTTTGAPAPYGLFLYNAEDPDAQTLRVMAPQGSYVGMKLALGMSAVCNSGFARDMLSLPLSTDSQMLWEHLRGYLFLRYEGRVETTGAPADGGAGSAPQPPTLIHMGGDIMNLGTTSAVPVRIDGNLSVPASTTGTGGSVDRRLWVAMDQIFKGATTDVDLTAFAFAALPDVAAGERLRRSGPDLPLMAFRP